MPLDRWYIYVYSQRATHDGAALSCCSIKRTLTLRSGRMLHNVFGHSPTASLEREGLWSFALRKDADS